MKVLQNSEQNNLEIPIYIYIIPLYMIKNYLKKYIYLQKKDRKTLIIWD